MGGEDDIIRKGKVTSLLYMHYTKLIRRIIELKKIWACMLKFIYISKNDIKFENNFQLFDF